MLENGFLINRRRRSLEPFLNPATALRIRNVHELGADGAAINVAGLLGKFAVNLQLGMRHGCQKAQRIEIGSQIPPMAKGVEHAFAFPLERRCFHERGVTGVAGLDWSGRHSLGI